MYRLSILLIFGALFLVTTNRGDAQETPARTTLADTSYEEDELQDQADDRDDDWDDEWDDEGWEEVDDGDVNDLRALLEVQVTSVAGIERSILSTPAAIYVLTADDIRRGGHLTIADALRMVPGLYVSQITSNIHSVAARGANPRFDNKLLVLVDGRAVYNDIFSGVNWDEQDLVLEDLDRIEVIRGPGATIWGANAVNGVINVVSRKASETQGWLFTGGFGDYHEGFGTVRYGGEINEETHYRAFAKYFARESFDYTDGDDSSDDWRNFTGGFRVDQERGDGLSLTFQGDIRHANNDELFNEVSLTAPFSVTRPENGRVRGGHALFRAERDLDGGAGYFLQGYYDVVAREGGTSDIDRETFDVEFRHHFPIGDRHELIYGFGYRHRSDHVRNPTLKLSFVPDQLRTDKISAFVQDTYRVVPDRFEVMIGSKFEYNDYSGFEVQPGLRAAWYPSQNQTVWASVSRAVRTPARVDQDVVATVRVIPPVPLLAQAVGDNGVDSEDLLAFELGYRVQPRTGLVFDIATYFNRFDDLSAVAPSPLNPLVSVRNNDADARVYGAELSATWQPLEWWQWVGSYQWYKANEHNGTGVLEIQTPDNVAHLRSLIDIGENFEWNVAAYYSDRKTDGNFDVPSYIRLDTGVTWRPCPGVELSFWGQNLTDSAHTEGAESFVIGRQLEVPRSIFAQFTLRF